MNATTPFTTARAHRIALVALFAALLAAMGMIPKIDLPLGVPITAQTMGVMLAGCMLGAGMGARSMLLFLAAVALGLPLLSGGRGGMGVFFAPSSGYLIGWPFGALVTGALMAWLPTSSPRKAAGSAFVAAALGGLLTVHAFGVVGLVAMARLSWEQAVLGTLVFVPGDLIKCLMCAMVVHTVARGLPDWRFGGRSAQ